MFPHSSDLYQSLAKMPKIDLHRHLEGSIRPDTFLELVLNQDVLLPTREPAELLRHVQVQPDEPPSFMNFLSKFFLLHYMYTSPEIYYRIMREVIEDAAKDNIIHLELRFSLGHLTRHNNFNMKDVIQWLHEARVQAEREFDISVLLIPMTNRESPREVAEKVVNASLAQPAGILAALDLAGDELHNPLPPYLDLFDRAREHGLFINTHAGEARGPDIVENSIYFLRPTRIGHGVRSVESRDTLELLKEQGIVLEVCPTSNIQTGASPSLRAHQLRALYDAGVKVTLNSDDPCISQTTLTQEYYIAMTEMGFMLDDLKRMVMNAAEASYLSRAAKTNLLKRLQAEWTLP
jgi:adenosine deaminase